MKNKFKKILLTFLAVTIASYSIVVPLAHAQEGKGNWWFPKYDEFLDKVNLAPPNEIFGERYTHAQVSWIVLSMLNIIVGPVASCAEKGTAGFEDCMIKALSQGQDPGALMQLAVINGALLSTKPVSSIDYVADKLDRLGVVNTVYAQDASTAGFGFANSLAVVRDLWKVSRDASYSLVIFMILILGFMIMFRAQISPRVSVTVQSALPRVVIGLLLITFSYAIAGLLVDLAFVTLGIVAGIISSSGLTSGIDAVTAFGHLNEVWGSMVNLFLGTLIGIFLGISTAGLSGAGIALFISGPAAGIIAGLTLIIILLIALVLLIAFIRVMWVMLRTYVVIIMLVIVSPFVFLYGIIKDGINAMWFKQMVANLSIFVTVGLLLFVGHYLVYATGGGVDTEFFGLDTNYYNINPSDNISETNIMPGFVNFAPVSLIGAILALAILVSTAKFASSIRDWIATGQAPRGGFGAESLGGVMGGGLGVGAFGAATGGMRNYAAMQDKAGLGAGASGFSMAQGVSGKAQYGLGKLLEAVQTKASGR